MKETSKAGFSTPGLAIPVQGNRDETEKLS